MSGFVSSPEAISNSPLSQRGWCFQERILSPRILHYTNQCIYWECREEYRCEDNLIFLQQNSNAKTVSSTVRIFEGLPADIWELEARVAMMPESTENSKKIFNDGEQDDGSSSLTSTPEPLLPHQAPHRKQDGLYYLHMALSPWKVGHGIERGSSGSGNPRKGEQWRLIAWWNKNIVTPYSGKHLTRVSDKLPEISAVARLFGEYIQAPYSAGLWLDEIEDGLDWRRAGATYQPEKLDYPSFSWIAQRGPVRWPYYVRLRPYGKAFSVMDYHVELSSEDHFGKISSASLTLYGLIKTVACIFAEQSDQSLAVIEGRILNKNGVMIGDVEIDSHIHPTTLECFYLYKNSIGFLKVLLLFPISDKSSGDYRRVGVGHIHPNFADEWIGGAVSRTIRLV